jgi:methyl-accepting chemotaxis protein
MRKYETRRFFKKNPKTKQKIKTRNRRLQHLHAIEKANQAKKGGAVALPKDATNVALPKDATNVALQNTGRVLAQTGVKAVDKIATPLIKSMGIDLNESTAQTVDRLVGPLETGVAVLKQPRVKKVVKEGLEELVDDLKPAMNKLAADSVSLVTNVVEDVAGPLIGIPRTLGNMADIAETGIELANKTMGNVSDMTNEISAAATDAASSVKNVGNVATNASLSASKSVADVSNNLNNLKQSQQRSFDNSKRSMAQLTNNPLHNKTMSRQAGGGKRRNKKTRKQSIFQQLHAYF